MFFISLLDFKRYIIRYYLCKESISSVILKIHCGNGFFYIKDYFVLINFRSFDINAHPIRGFLKINSLKFHTHTHTMYLDDTFLPIRPLQKFILQFRFKNHLIHTQKYNFIIFSHIFNHIRIKL